MSASAPGPVIVQYGTAPCEQALARLARMRTAGGDLEDTRWAVEDILRQVQEQGDAALLRLTRELDGVDVSDGGLEVDPALVRAAPGRLEPGLRAALERMVAAVRAYQQDLLAGLDRETFAGGVSLRTLHRPVDRAGIYAPGGRARYPSSVVMNVVPARAAGVGQVLLATPPGPDGLPAVEVLAAAALSGVDRVFRVGGAQAVAALALGTATVPAVDVVAGPGNRYVAVAKQLLYGLVGVDLVAGPSEVVVVADDTADPDTLAWDLLAQAEHDPDAVAVLVALDPDTARRTAQAAAAALDTLPEASPARRSWPERGLVLVAPDTDRALQAVDRLAPEHLHLWCRGAEDLALRVGAAGAVFVGPCTPVAAGDYLLGPSHTLPTGGAARFQSGLSVSAFLKRRAIMQCTPEAWAGLRDDVALLARAEGLEAHARSTIRPGPGADGASKTGGRGDRP